MFKVHVSFTVILVGLVLALAATSDAQAETIRGAQNKPSNPGIWMAPDGTGQPVLPSEAQKRAASRLRITGSGINYNGGPVIVTKPNIYVIWYGNWNQSDCCSSDQSVRILQAFLQNITGSAWMGVNKTYYYLSTSSPVTGTSYYVPSGATMINNSYNYFDTSYVAGTSLSDTSINTIVQNAIKNGKLPLDDNALYFVLTSGDVIKSGFGTQYCGWHTYATISSKIIKYSFVGNPQKYMSACAAQLTSPNGNAAADAMASVIAHELVETISDPQISAWYDSRGYENADKCAWKFGTPLPISGISPAYKPPGGGQPGGSYNVSFPVPNPTNANFPEANLITYWYVQQNWKNSGTGSCDVK